MADMNVIHTYLAVTTDVPDQGQEMASVRAAALSYIIAKGLTTTRRMRKALRDCCLPDNPLLPT